jgi:uncharacterized membrane protein
MWVGIVIVALALWWFELASGWALVAGVLALVAVDEVWFQMRARREEARRLLAMRAEVQVRGATHVIGKPYAAEHRESA